MHLFSNSIVGAQKLSEEQDNIESYYDQHEVALWKLISISMNIDPFNKEHIEVNTKNKEAFYIKDPLKAKEFRNRTRIGLSWIGTNGKIKSSLNGKSGVKSLLAYVLLYEFIKCAVEDTNWELPDRMISHAYPNENNMSYQSIIIFFALTKIILKKIKNNNNLCSTNSQAKYINENIFTPNKLLISDSTVINYLKESTKASKDLSIKYSFNNNKQENLYKASQIMINYINEQDIINLIHQHIPAIHKAELTKTVIRNFLNKIK